MIPVPSGHVYEVDELDKIKEQFGTVLYEADDSAPYETDVAILLKKNRKYTMMCGSACSCYEAAYDGWTEMTKTEVKNLAKTWVEKSYGAEKLLGEWIQTNIKEI